VKALISINKGFEKLFDGVIAPKFIELLEGESNNAVVVEFDSIEKMCLYVYRTQVANSVSLFIDRNKDVDKLKVPDSIRKIIPKAGKFRITTKTGYEEETGVLFNEHKVDLKNPDFNIELDEFDGEFFLSLDLSGDLSKRDYKVFNNPLSMKGTTAFGVLMLSGYRKGHSLLNPFCNSGTLEIEAALFDNDISARFYDKDFPFIRLNIDKESVFKDADSKAKSEKLDITAADPLLRNITAARKNAKIAGVEKYLNFRRIDIDWMDIKHDEKTFDHIITFIPGSSKHKSPNDLKKEFEQLFYQSEYIIKKDGTVSILCLSKDLLMESATKYLDLKDTIELYSGTQLMYLLMFKKKTGKKSDKDKSLNNDKSDKKAD
jgi:hypothetical protein